METENPLCISLFLDFQKIWILNITMYTFPDQESAQRAEEIINAANDEVLPE